MTHICIAIRRFRLRSWENPVDLSHHRWVVDTEVDLQFIREVSGKFTRSNSDFRTRDLVAFLEQRPELMQMNRDVKQKHANNRF